MLVCKKNKNLLVYSGCICEEKEDNNKCKLYHKDPKKQLQKNPYKTYE